MATIEITTPDGKTIELNAPEGASPDQIHQAAMNAVSHYTGQLQQSNPTWYQKVADVENKAGEAIGKYTKPAMQMRPTTPMGVVASGMGQVQNLANKAGQFTAESLAKNGQISPQVAAGLGTAVQMSPDILMAAAAPEGSVANTAKAMAPEAETVIDPATRLMQLKNQMRDLPINKELQLTELQRMKGEASKALQTAQVQNNIGMAKTGIPSIPKNMDSFASKVGKFGAKNPDDIATQFSLGDLQRIKDTVTMAKQANALLPAHEALINQGMENIDAAIAKQAPDLGRKLADVRTIKNATEALDNNIVVRKMQIQKAMDQIRNDMRLSKTTKVSRITNLLKKVGAIAGTGVAAELGWQGGKKFFD